MAAACVWWLRATPRTAGPLHSQFYVWQRVWDGAVRDAVRTAPEAVAGLAPLCAEITWDAQGKGTAAWPTLAFGALRDAARPVSAVLRFGLREPSMKAVDDIRAVAIEVLARLRAARIEPVELQVDFDSAESQLRGYRAWLAALRAAVAPLPVRPTVLPSWLGRGEFSALARECGAYVLQVHATGKPRVDSPETALCDAANARRWVEQAGRLGVPFRVALPTYTYRIAFTADGKLLATEAEGATHAWPEGTVLRAFRPNAADLAALVGEWTKDRPASLTGLLWYRLPVSTDAQNWRWPTLAAVMQGRPPRHELRVEKSGASPTDLVLINAGEDEAPLPARVIATAAGGIESADGVGGYRAEWSEKQVIFHRAESLAPARLAPGARHPVGWLRAGAELQIQTQSP